MNEPHQTAQTMLVRKRDGLSEPFVKSKIIACLRTVLQTTDEGSTGTAEELAHAVTKFFVDSRPNGTLRSHDIAALLPRVLDQTGHPQAASLLKEHTRMRDRLRRIVRVMAFKPSIGKVVPRRWNKSNIVTYLREQHNLEAEVARFIGGHVETQVLGLGIEVVTGGLVRELAASMMLVWGLADAAFDVHATKPKHGDRHRREKR